MLSPIPPVSAWQVVGMIASALAILLILGSLACLWLKWKENYG